jgi:hypothetical protein
LGGDENLAAGHVDLRVTVLAQNEFFQKGKQQVGVVTGGWPAGIYLLQIRTGRNGLKIKLVLLTK